MIVRVTQDNIARGRRSHSRHCPVALAMRDAGLRYPSAWASAIWWDEDDEHEFVMEMPDEVFDRILSYDKGCPMEPFEFELDTAVAERHYCPVGPIRQNGEVG